jgi:sporulation protein YlmC with PRC-barrel domain
MLLSDLVTLPVRDSDGTRIGVVTDARFALDPDSLEATLMGLLVGPRAHSTFLGYERKSQTRPALLARFLSRRERGVFLILFDDVGSIEPDAVRLRSGYTRYSAELPSDSR